MSTVWCAGSLVGLVSAEPVSAGSVIGPNLGQGEGVVLGRKFDLLGQLIIIQ